MILLYNKLDIRGANSIYFVGVPSYPEFYSDLVNAMSDKGSEKEELSVGVTVLYSKYDTYAVSEKEQD